MNARSLVQGMKFGRLTTVASQGVTNHGKYLWLCDCDCGGQIVTLAASLKNGRTKSCGCIKSEISREALKNLKEKRGYKRKYPIGFNSSNHPLRTIWANMRQRCNNPKHKNYHQYGGRGIKVSPQWNSFYQFTLDVGDRPSGTTLDRFPDKNGNYEPGNVRWATEEQQKNNTRSNREITFMGRTLNLCQWGRELGISRETISMRIKRGWTIADALSRPLKKGT